MNTDPAIRFACTEKFAELCALSTAGSLTDEELTELESHLVRCEQCRAVLADYQSLASDGMGKLAAELASLDGAQNSEHVWAQDEARSRLLSKLGAKEPALELVATEPVARDAAILPKLVSLPLRNATPYLGMAAVFLLSVFVAFQFGVKTGLKDTASQSVPRAVEASLRQQLAGLVTQREALSKAVNDVQDRATGDEKELARLRGLRASLEERTQRLDLENQQQAESLGSVSGQRDTLRRKLEDAERSLNTVQEDLNTLREERRKALLNGAGLEAQIQQLSAQLRERDETIDRQQQFLVSDRDIRELMGARQLYIADVFDVDSQGKTRKPFGRVFYTKGKSLVFYAFDLDRQPGYREAKAFQAWGRPDSDQAQPISLGIFYMDSEANRRWVLKSNDPKVLAQIDAVFVTVEPKGGSKKPSGKALLYAYLRKAPPNHP